MPDWVWLAFTLVAFFSGISLGMLVGFGLGVRYAFIRLVRHDEKALAALREQL